MSEKFLKGTKANKQTNKKTLKDLIIHELAFTEKNDNS